ncbi:protein MIGRI [Neisseria shayeganii]|uniref:Uncharacterized protein n=2 Tax=Neisseria shayeganii TaxID=607712 RepID=G4CGI6_9NEIS|nr:hypothetical protein [Neisseria shayeganii]EGY53059.1 hypothetical protein HMPREF9371_0725 [Neisseria shayeganii 871]QMT39786.1 hypothetical protein H3L94_07870 [Neisseria shayeganii]
MSATLWKLIALCAAAVWLLRPLLPAAFRRRWQRHIRHLAWIVLAVFGASALWRLWTG